MAMAEARRDLLGEAAEIRAIAHCQVLVEAKAQFVTEALASVALTDDKKASLDAAIQSKHQQLEYEWQASIIDPIKADQLEAYRAEVEVVYNTHLEQGRTKVEKNTKGKFPCLFNEALNAAHLCAEAEACNEGIRIKEEHLTRIHDNFDTAVHSDECVIVIAAAQKMGLTADDIDPAQVAKAKHTKIAPWSATAKARTAEAAARLSAGSKHQASPIPAESAYSPSSLAQGAPLPTTTPPSSAELLSMGGAEGVVPASPAAHVPSPPSPHLLSPGPKNFLVELEECVLGLPARVLTVLPSLPDEDLKTVTLSMHNPVNRMSISPPPHILTPDKAPFPEMLDVSRTRRVPFEEDGQELGASTPPLDTPTLAPIAALQFSGTLSPEFALLYQALTDQMGVIRDGLMDSLAVITTRLNRLEGVPQGPPPLSTVPTQDYRPPPCPCPPSTGHPRTPRIPDVAVPALPQVDAPDFVPEFIDPGLELNLPPATRKSVSWADRMDIDAPLDAPAPTPVPLLVPSAPAEAHEGSEPPPARSGAGFTPAGRSWKMVAQTGVHLTGRAIQGHETIAKFAKIASTAQGWTPQGNLHRGQPAACLY
jgi:hypothetical protein